MPLYPFVCKTCGKEEELFYHMNEEKVPPKCCGKDSARVYDYQVPKDLRYQGQYLFEKPVEIHSKRQWKRELKKRGLTDDFGNVMSCEKSSKRRSEEFSEKRRKIVREAYEKARGRIVS